MAPPRHSHFLCTAPISTAPELHLSRSRGKGLCSEERNLEHELVEATVAERCARPYIWNVEKDSGPRFVSLLAFRLEAAASHVGLNEETLLAARQGQVKFLQRLPLGGPRESLQWRFHFRPDCPAEVNLLARVRSGSPESALTEAVETGSQIERQLRLLEPVYSFSPIAERASFERLFNPFHARFMVNFWMPSWASAPNQRSRATPNLATADDWFRLCSLLGSSLLVTWTLSPVAMFGWQRQRMLSGRNWRSPAIGFSSATEQISAKEHEDIPGSLVGLNDVDLYSIRIQVASDAPLSSSFLDVLAKELASSGASSTGDSDFRSYIWQLARKPKDIEAAIDSMFWLDQSRTSLKNPEGTRENLVNPSVGDELDPLARIPTTITESDANLLPIRSVTPICIGEPSSGGILLGVHRGKGKTVSIRLNTSARLLHSAMFGATGTGKTTLMERLILEDIAAGRGVGVLDPHGDLALRVLHSVPDSRWEDVVYLDFSEFEYPVGLNLFAAFDRATADSPRNEQLLHDFVGMLVKLYPPEMIGPICQQNLINALKLIQWNPNRQATLVDLPRCFVDADFRRSLLSHCADPFVLHFWRKIDAQTSGTFKGETLQYLISKITPFMDNSVMRNILAQDRCSFDIHEVLSGKKILVANLAKGSLGERNCYLLGMILLRQIEQAALMRDPSGAEAPWFLYLDEFHNCATEHFSQMLSEMRKFSVGMIVASQCFAQIDVKMREAILANAGTLASFRINPHDAAALESIFWPHVNSNILCRLPNHQAVCRIAGDKSVGYFSIETLPSQLNDLPVSPERIRSAARKNARPRKEVQDRISADYLSSRESPLPKGQTSSTGTSDVETQDE